MQIKKYLIIIIKVIKNKIKKQLKQVKNNDYKWIYMNIMQYLKLLLKLKMLIMQIK